MKIYIITEVFNLNWNFLEIDIPKPFETSFDMLTNALIYCVHLVPDSVSLSSSSSFFLSLFHISMLHATDLFFLKQHVRHEARRVTSTTAHRDIKPWLLKTFRKYKKYPFFFFP